MHIDMEAWAPFEANVAGAEFSGRRFDWQPGFYVRTIDGLLSGGRISVDEIPRLRGPGTLYTPGKRDTARGILIAGFAYAKSMIELATLADQFDGILSDEEDFDVLNFRELGRWRQTTVGKSAVSGFGRAGRNRIAPFELVLRAPDQRIYGEPLETSGWGQSVTVTNRGTYKSPVVIRARRVSSDVNGYTITGPGGSVIVTATLGTQVHYYDADDGTLTINGADASTSVSRADRIEVPRGTHTFTVSAGVEILVEGNDTYNP